jgi:hypothetical protein
MNDIERRTLLGAAGIGAIAAISKAGPLNPPAGSVAPTGRTLDEVYDRIPVVGGSDGRTPIPGGATAASLSTPGSYVLTGNIATAGAGITISAPNVTLDLNGFTVSSTNTSASVISITPSAHGAVVRNGVVSGGQACVTAQSGVVAVLVEDVSVVSAKLNGINMPNCPGSIVRRCRVRDIGATTLATDTVAVNGIDIGGPGALVDGCSVHAIRHNNPAGLLRGISAGPNTEVNGCMIANVTTPANSVGLFQNINAALRRNCRVLNFATAYSGGIDGGGNF